MKSRTLLAYLTTAVLSCSQPDINPVPSKQAPPLQSAKSLDERINFSGTIENIASKTIPYRSANENQINNWQGTQYLLTLKSQEGDLRSLIYSSGDPEDLDSLHPPTLKAGWKINVKYTSWQSVHNMAPNEKGRFFQNLIYPANPKTKAELSRFEKPEQRVDGYINTLKKN